MSGETEKDESGWTTDTLNYALSQRIDELVRAMNERADALSKLLDERYATQTKALDAAFAAADKAVQAALLSAEKAVAKAEAAAERRFDSVNEFRGQLSDQASTFMPRAEAAAIQQRTDERLNDLAERAKFSGGSNAGVRLTAGVLAASLGAMASVVIIVNIMILLFTR